MSQTMIGLEIHVELSTKTKMFCGCKNEFGATPNTNLCPVCLGHPGALPMMNREAVRYGIMAGLAFDCEIHQNMKMDRKKYFYPDLTKGYQITQEETPLCTDGRLVLKTDQGDKEVRIQRIHLEEDTGKSNYDEEGNSLMDYNRSGVPLIEIVTRPDLSSAEEARQFLDMLRERILFLGISDVKMSEGSLRCDVNINKIGDGIKTEITEVKNLNSFRSVVRAIEFEEKRHQELLAQGQVGEHETRRWDEEGQETVIMRQKGAVNDYRFTVEGDIPRLYIDQAQIDQIRAQLPELPHDKMERFIEEYGLEAYDADILTRGKGISDYFEAVNGLVKNPALVANWILTDVSRRVNEHEMDFAQMKMSPENLGKLILLVDQGKINNNTGKKVLRSLFEENFDPEAYVRDQGLLQMSDEGALEAVVLEVLEENPESVAEVRAGRDRVLGFLVGQAMKKTQGKGNPQFFSQKLREKIEDL